MATEVIALQLTTDTKQAEQSVGSFKKQLKDATSELVNMSMKFGETSTQAAEAAKKVAKLKDSIGDAKALADTFNPDKKFVALGGALQGVTAGFSAFSGAMGVLGADSKETEKLLLKVQSAMALQQGISGIMGAKDAFILLGKDAVTAFGNIKKAIGGTGIGLLVIALGTIYQYWDDIKGAVDGVGVSQKKLNKDSDENLKTQQKKLDTIGNQDNILKLQGKTEKEILQIKIKQTDETIAAAKVSIVNAEATRDAQIKAAERNKDILMGMMNFISLPLTALLRGIDAVSSVFGKKSDLMKGFQDFGATLIFDPAKTKKDGDATISASKNTLINLQNQRAGNQLAIKEIDKAEGDLAAGIEKTKEEKENIAKQKRLDLQAQFKVDNQKAKQDENIQDATDRADKLKLLDKNNLEDIGKKMQNAQKETEIKQDAANAQIEIDKKLVEQKRQLVQDTANALGTLSDVVGKETGAGKTLAIAQALINTYLGISKGISMGMPWGIPSIIAAAAVGFKTVKDITAVKVPKSTNSSTPSMATPSAPIMPQTEVQTTRLDQSTINAVGNAAGRAYVLESDVSNNQERIRRLNRAARIN